MISFCTSYFSPHTFLPQNRTQTKWFSGCFQVWPYKERTLESDSKIQIQSLQLSTYFRYKKRRVLITHEAERMLSITIRYFISHCHWFLLVLWGIFIWRLCVLELMFNSGLLFLASGFHGSLQIFHGCI